MGASAFASEERREKIQSSCYFIPFIITVLLSSALDGICELVDADEVRQSPFVLTVSGVFTMSAWGLENSSDTQTRDNQQKTGRYY